jgi:hypothetical protein
VLPSALMTPPLDKPATPAENEQPVRRLPDAVLRALARAPVGRPDTEEEARTIAEGRGAGELIPGELVSAEIAEQCRRQT